MINYLQITPDLLTYVRECSAPESDALRGLRERTAALPEAMMQVPPEQGRLLTLLTLLTGARRVLEIGVFTGYSTLCLATGVPADGTVLGIERNQQWLDIARPFWDRAGVGDRIETVTGEAEQVLDAMTDPFDLIFIDADKERYDHYYEAALRLARPGALVIVDNTLHFGRVVDPEAPTDDPEYERMRPQYRALDRLNRKIAVDPRVDCGMVPAFDGLTLCRVRESGDQGGVIDGAWPEPKRQPSTVPTAGL
ncbi:class I SAM-dependent methyltransferase [Solwaraspora sp. WMMD406]|uniref:O-methyltransferase n=1 Tax=Solwaraspora sp. WMMD406 TaxID=3016095 RepID=UPI00241778E8|nr:class I SAM-dependent methyltransferase [Solwaraspora sp. WMMD406]MDG4765807.1 class I SAM-dependent methyltransferase [Solwaraspora sp. WMMD406]